MTTGAIQHQFRDKASLLAAVVERGFERMIDQLARLPGSSQPVEERVGALVRVLWQGYDAASTRASLEILFAMRHDAAFQQVPGLTDRIDPRRRPRPHHCVARPGVVAGGAGGDRHEGESERAPRDTREDSPRE